MAGNESDSSSTSESRSSFDIQPMRSNKACHFLSDNEDALFSGDESDLVLSDTLDGDIPLPPESVLATSSATSSTTDLSVTVDSSGVSPAVTPELNFSGRPKRSRIQRSFNALHDDSLHCADSDCEDTSNSELMVACAGPACGLKVIFSLLFLFK